MLVACATPAAEPTREPPPAPPGMSGAKRSEPTTRTADPAQASRSSPSTARPPTCVGTPFVWHRVEPGLEVLDTALDLDGDQRPDRLRGSASWGSSEESRTVTVELTRDHSTIEASTSVSFTSMVGRQAVPARLLGLHDVRRAVELALFDRVCDVPDPSLARVLSGAPAWSPGRPTLVDNYTVLVGSEWVSYSAMNHRRTSKLDVTGGFTRRAQHGSLVLLTTAHGAVLVDERGERYSWLFVVETALRKFRVPSVTSAEVRGDHAVVTVDGKALVVALPAR